MQKIEMSTLLKYASFGGLLCFGSAAAYRQQITRRVKEQSYFKEAIEKLEKHKAASILGKPVLHGFVDVYSGRTYANTHEVNIYLNVKGSEIKGELFLNAEKSTGDTWLLKRVELELKDNLGGKVLIYNCEDEEESSLQ